MAEYIHPDPIVQIADIQELAHDVVVIPSRRVQLVPNIGVVGGTESVLIIDTGMGPANAEKVLTFATEYAKGRKLYLTTTHFHPEHSFGAQAFAGEATFLINRAQANDLVTKGPAYIEMFKGLGAPVAKQLEGVQLASADLVYDSSYDLDLGGRVVQLRATGRAHSKGDQVVTVPDAGALFTGDLVESAQFAIFPWYPPYETDVSGVRWLEVMQRLVAQTPRIVIPGHNDVGGPQLLADVRDYLTLLRDETWVRRASSMIEDTIIEEVQELMIGRHPDWEGQEWIAQGVQCLCTEHLAVGTT